MRPRLLLFSAVLQSQMLISVWGQPSIGCFVEGKCLASGYTDQSTRSGGELKCLEHCVTIEDSNYFSYDLETAVSMVIISLEKVFLCNLSLAGLCVLA